MIDIDWGGLYWTNIILDSIAIVILLVLIVIFVKSGRKVSKKEGKTEDRMFFSICLMSMGLAVVDALVFINNILFEDMHEGNEPFFFLGDPGVGILTLLTVVQWLLFVEYTLHQSKDLIRRRYPVVLIPFAVAALLEVSSIYPMFEAMLEDNIDLWDVGDHIHQISTVVTLFYIILIYIIIYMERKRTKLPRYIMTKPMEFSVLFGFLLDSLTDFSILAIAFALGLIFMEYSMLKRSDWEDDKTGCYNENYIQVIMDHVVNNHINGGTIIRISTKDDSEVLAEILRSMEPENSKTVFMGDGTFLVVTETQPETVIEWYLSLINGQAEEKGIGITCDHFTRTDETPEEFLKACLKA